MKRCSRCRIAKPRDCFGRCAAQKDGLQDRCRDCRVETNRKYRTENRDLIREQNAKYRAENHDSIIERSRKYQEANRDKIRKYYAENRQAHKDRARKWAATNPDRSRLIAKNKQHRRRAGMRGGMSPADLHQWESGQLKVCHWCGAKCADNFHIDHRVALASGGKHEARNLVIACPPCNQSKGARCPIEFAQSRGRLL